MLQAILRTLTTIHQFSTANSSTGKLQVVHYSLAGFQITDLQQSPKFSIMFLGTIHAKKVKVGILREMLNASRGLIGREPIWGVSSLHPQDTGIFQLLIAF